MPVDCHSSQVEKMIDVIVKQTAYTKEEAAVKLQEHNNDFVAVIKEYLGVELDAQPTKKVEARTTNQMIFHEIRGMMDDAAKRFYANKRREELVQQLKQRQQAHVLAQQAQSQQAPAEPTQEEAIQQSS